ncbi:hypothetical protein FH608_004940 [Nonomuraea phyllanthi]|uniref:Uncharacterized protein n=1 Tax=Nonomuraea phyllanthi TaxID=2219224 RepID=A0A5C4WXB2_9ACTN|nr:hypothetical protein [Nonomuraea phyllanthi]KAB8197863.1 hypothetical protein FH608_004940 [Nonomuraea phyllanthi]
MADRPRLPKVLSAVRTLMFVQSILGILVGLADGSFPLMGIVPLAFSVPVLMNLLRHDVRAWFAGEEAALP